MVNPPAAVNYKIGNEKLVKLTEQAGARLASLLRKQGREQGALRVAVIGNGDLTTAAAVRLRRAQTGVAGVMLGRGAMSAPWIFREIHEYLDTGIVPDPLPLADQWAFIQRHCALAVAHSGEEPHTMAGMRSRLMAYSRGMPAAKQLREQFSSVSSLAMLGDIAAAHLEAHAAGAGLALLT